MQTHNLTNSIAPNAVAAAHRQATQIEINIAVVKALYTFERRLLHHPLIPDNALDAITALREEMTDQLPISCSALERAASQSHRSAL
ncbi:MAG: hypothetical protein SFX19_10025 [Alphaproteobacteria bacterium]|nr:hypothetical protein [Alphaproteobacteria bacterium]